MRIDLDILSRSRKTFNRSATTTSRSSNARGFYHVLTRDFCTRGNEREFTLEGSWYADEEIQAGTDRDLVAAG
jgi:hypothetical protein